MINIQLTELDLSLEVAEISELAVTIDEHSTVSLQGPLVFGVNASPLEYGYLDLDLIGFPYHGLSAYELAVQNGFVGSLAQWLESLIGPPGTLSDEGLDAVIRAETAATSASGHATAAAGFRTEAFTYSGYAGVHAQSANEMYTQALAMRDETGQIAQAFTTIYQQSEAMLIGTTELAIAVIQERVLAETARSNAEAAETRTASSMTSAAASAASASDQATLAVEARNTAADKAAAAVLSSSEASSFADDARIEAAASQTSQIQASAARDEANITAAAVVIDAASASASATDAEASATAANLERIAAEVARDLSGTYAEASLEHSEIAEAHVTDASAFASAADTYRIAAETSAGNASVSETNSATSEFNANGARVAAESARDVSVAAADEAGNYATTAASHRDAAEIFADEAGVIYGAVATRVDTLETTIDTPTTGLSARVTSTETAIVDLETQNEEARIEFVASTGGGDAIFRLGSTTYAGTMAGLYADQIYWGENTIFDDMSDTLRTTVGLRTKIIALGSPFGTDSTLTEWEGPSSVTWGLQSRANAYHYTARVAPFEGGSERIITTERVNPFAITKSWRYESASVTSNVAFGAMTARHTLFSITFTATGSEVAVDASFYVKARHDQDSYDMIIVVEGGGSGDRFLATIPAQAISGDGHVAGWQVVSFTHTPTAGTVTYSVRVYHVYAIGSPGSFAQWDHSNRTINVRKYER
jgi:hypothetical protein